MKTLQEVLTYSLEDCKRVVEQLYLPSTTFFIQHVAELLADCFRRNHKVLIAGNGGSLCDAMHFAQELTGFFRQQRPAWSALPLSDSAHMSCTGNDLGFEKVFARGVEAHGRPGDIFVGLTTSGNSPNLIHAFDEAKQRGLKTIAFLGKGGGKLKGIADIEFLVENVMTSDRIQEAHMTAIHLIIELIEAHLVPPKLAMG